MTVESLTHTDTHTDTPADNPANPVRLPLNESQKGLLVIDRAVPVRNLYNIVFELELDPAVRPDRIRAAVSAAVALQPALRLVFTEPPAVAAVLRDPSRDPAGASFETVDLVDDDTVGRVLSRLSRLEFSLADGPLYHVAHVHSATRSVLFLVVHHLVFDGYSLRPLLNDVDAVLSGRITAEDVDRLRPVREESFRREVAAQARVAGAEATLRKADQWAAELRDVPATVLYPRPNRPGETAFTGARFEWALDGVESAEVRACCRRLGISAFEFFTAVYGTVLARHAGSRSVTIGSPFMARQTVGALDLCGFFVNTLPVVLDVDWTSGFDEYAAGVGDAVARARSRLDVAFGQLVDRVQPDRLTNRNPVFSCMLAMQDTSDFPSVVRSVRERCNGTAKFDLWLGVTPVGDRWLLELEYDRELLPVEVAEGLLTSLRVAAGRAAADGSAVLGDLTTDQSLDLSRRTDGFRAWPSARSLVGWWRDTASRQPERPAVEDQGRTTSYRQLVEAVDQVAAGLHAYGVRVGDVVGLRLDCLSDTVTAMLAVMSRGAAYLPLAADLPADRLRYMIDKSGCRLVIGPDGSAGDRHVAIAELGDAGRRAGPPPPAEEVSAPYVMFTSGSTGAPKGIQMSHESLWNLTTWQVAALRLGEETRFLQYAPLGFDVSFQEIVPTLAAGGTVVCREPADRRDFFALVDRVRDGGVTHVYLPVSALRPFVRAAGERAAQFTRLRYVCVSGEQLTVDAEIQEFFRQHRDCVLVNLYGPTETHAVTTHRLGGTDDWPEHVPIGTPLAGVTAYVLDVAGRLAPAGVPGELHLGGRCPAHGYVNDPERTAQGFLPDRFAGTGVMYRTGDQVLRDENGDLIFLGRNDDQVKIRGFRVELGEIEAAVNRSGFARHAVAAVRDTGADRELVVFVVTGTGAAADPAVLRDWLRRELPAYMVPAQVFTVDSVPVTKNGKVDRSALLATVDGRIAASAPGAGDAPGYADELERDLGTMWTELTGATGITRDRSLLECGANSLMVFSALHQIKKRYGVELSIIDFFRTPTVAAVAGLVRSAG